MFIMARTQIGTDPTRSHLASVSQGVIGLSPVLVDGGRCCSQNSFNVLAMLGVMLVRIANPLFF